MFELAGKWLARQMSFNRWPY